MIYYDGLTDDARARLRDWIAATMRASLRETADLGCWTAEAEAKLRETAQPLDGEAVYEMRWSRTRWGHAEQFFVDDSDWVRTPLSVGMLNDLSLALDPQRQGAGWPSPAESDGRPLAEQARDLLVLADESDDPAVAREASVVRAAMAVRS